MFKKFLQFQYFSTDNRIEIGKKKFHIHTIRTYIHAYLMFESVTTTMINLNLLGGLLGHKCPLSNGRAPPKFK